MKTDAQSTAPKPTTNSEPGRGKSGGHLYLQVANALKDDIVSGIYPVGAQLPTEDELCTRFSVSRYTVREALRRLRDDHLVASRQGAGTVVIPRRSNDTYVHEVMEIGDLLDWASGTRFTIDLVRLGALDGRTAERTGLPEGEEWLAVRGFRFIEGIDAPACCTEYFIHRDYAAVGRLLQRHTGPIFPLIEDLFGLSIVEVHQEIAAALIGHALAVHLKAKPNAPALEVRRTYRITDGKTAQVTINTHPAGLFRHSMTLKRVRG